MPDFHLLTVVWYRQNSRELPWRETKNPYFIWLSEIILQQTRVNQGLSYYLKFVETFPDVSALANASEQEVLNLWQGLGYYSRARNLHAAAKMVDQQFGGVFPSSYEEIKSLKGVGEYTAAAIASFAFDLSYPVVDGNVFRVLSRVFDISTPIDTTAGKKLFTALAADLLGENPPAIHNQAIMELGALQCVPVNPDCKSCPVQVMCLAYERGIVGERPVKSKKIASRDRFFHYLQIENEKQIVIEKRTGKDIWQHLYQFPLLEQTSRENPEMTVEKIKQHFGVDAFMSSPEIKHVLSHQNLYTVFWKARNWPESIKEDWVVIDMEELMDYPLPRLIDRYLSDPVSEK